MTDKNQLEVIEDTATNGLVESIKSAISEMVEMQLNKILDRVGKNEDRVINLENEIEENKEMIEAAKKVNTGSKVYFNQTEIGHTYKPAVSNKSIGDILRIIGFAYKSTPTTPLMSSAINTGIAKKVGQGWRWEREKVDKKWLKWLKENDLYVEWNKHTTPTERRIFITEIHEEIVKN